jgi:hypothetical protein
MGSPDLIVDSDTRLDRFLRRNRIQMWRIPILVAKGGVKVFRGNGKEVPLKDAKTRVDANDRVRLISPLPSACVQALQKEANTNWRDYAIVPGSTPFDKQLAKFVQARDKTTLIKDPSMLNLRGFFDGLATSDQIVNPVRHLLIVGHGGMTGAFHIALFAGFQDVVVTYEDLEKALKDKSLIMDLSLMMPRPVEKTGKSQPNLRLLGCSIGGEVPFMKKFKEALGGQIVLVAPKHFLIGATLVNPPGECAYMDYNFTVYFPSLGPKDPARKKADVVAAFVKKSNSGDFKREDKNAVPKKAWNEWVPKQPNDKPNPVDLDHAPSVKVTVRNPVFPGTSQAPRRFVYRKNQNLFARPQTMPLQKDTGNEADRRKAVKTWLQGVERWKDGHAFPEFVRYGYKTMDECMDGWNWQFSYDKKAKVLTYNPIRDIYRALLPITKVATNTLVMNYYPTGRVPERFKSQMPIEMLQVNDTFYFGTY